MRIELILIKGNQKYVLFALLFHFEILIPLMPITQNVRSGEVRSSGTLNIIKEKCGI